MQQSKQYNTVTIQRLTALWALGESGLGGWMHALKLPFTGIFVGGFAVICIALLAHYTRGNYRQMIQATLLVLLVKFAVSPQSPPPAYLAVGFQGFIGALLYSAIRNYKVASVIFGIVAMLESALQKLIVMTLIYGSSLWEALNKMFNAIAEDFSLGERSFSFWLIAIYIGMYAVWGLILGVWLCRLPHTIDHKAAISAQQLATINKAEITLPTTRKKKKGAKWLTYIILLALLAGVFLIDNKSQKALYLVVRTLTVLALFYTVINPLIKWWLKRRLEKATGKNQQAVHGILELLPELRSFLSPAYKLAAQEHRNWKRYPAFVVNLIMITIHPPANGPE